MRLKLSILANILFVMFGCFVIIKRYFFQQTPHAGAPIPPSYYEPYIQGRMNVHAACPIDTNDIIMIGTSLTEGFPIETLKNCHIKNRGIAASQLRHLLERIDGIIAARPKQLFIEMGTNEIDRPADSIKAAYATLFNKLVPLGKKIYLQSIPPMDSPYLEKNRKIDSLNSFLRAICGATAIHYIDINSVLKKGHGLNPSLTYDGIHLNAAGYSVWRRTILPYL